VTFRSLVLVHGSGSGPWVFEGWERSFPELTVTAVDLQAGLDVAHATLRDYAVSIVRAVTAADRRVAVCAWSLGGLAAMFAAGEARPDALILLEPSPPLEVQGLRDIVPRPGTFDPLAAGAPFPAGMAARPESSLATGERERGVSVPSLPPGTRTLVVAGDAFRDERGPRFAERYGGVFLDAGTAEHWDLVRDPAIRALIAAWLDEL
jgi:hypothetical protein